MRVADDVIALTASFLGVALICNEVILTRQDLEDGGEVETSALHQSEQLITESYQGGKAENYRQDHEGLHGLDPI